MTQEKQAKKSAIRVSHNSAENDSFLQGAERMLEHVLDFMRNFRNEQGEFPLYDYIGNVRKEMEKLKHDKYSRDIM